VDSRKPTREISPQARQKGHPPRKGLLLLCPHRMVESVWEVDPDELVQRGIRGLILDLDNTLVRWREEEMTQEVTTWLARVQERGIRLCIMSNSLVGSRSVRIAQRLGAVNVSRARKPSKQGFQRALIALGSDPAATAIVGDQMFTDILGGNRAGIYTIMVKQLHHHEFAYTRYVSRPPERLLLRLFKKRGHL
jgi:HAD superfamily phosphatase (TIGR01668 family)